MIESLGARRFERIQNDFSIDDRPLGKFGKGFDKVRVLMVERFVPTR